MLELRGITTGYGGTPVVHDTDLTVQAGEIVTHVDVVAITVKTSRN
jgi:hypothetical protein